MLYALPPPPACELKFEILRVGSVHCPEGLPHLFWGTASRPQEGPPKHDPKKLQVHARQCRNTGST